MNHRERLTGIVLSVVVLFSWLAFAFHVDPRFAGSYVGGILGIAGALLLLATFAYVPIKRLPWLRRLTTRIVSLRTALNIHVYAGVFGAVLGLIHTGHKFESLLGIALVSLMLAVVFSGLVGRYFMTFVSDELREKRISLSQLEQRYREVLVTLANTPQQRSAVQALVTSPFLAWLPRASPDLRMAKDALSLSDSIADLEYAVESHTMLKRLFRGWVTFHIILSIALAVLLVAHIWSALYFGVRWLQ